MVVTVVAASGTPWMRTENLSVLGELSSLQDICTLMQLPGGWGGMMLLGRIS